MKKLNEKGNVAIILCLVITAMFGFLAYVADIGIVYVERIKLSNSLDSAALAAVMELPSDEVKARNVAIEYLVKNYIDTNNTRISFSNNSKAVEIEGTKSVKHLLAKLIGINNSEIGTRTKALVAPVKAITGGIRPFAVEKFDYVYGQVVTLKENAGDGYYGNYGAVALGGNGANIFKDNSLYGYNGKISIGDYIDTEPGNIASASNLIKGYINSEASDFSNFKRTSIRLWTIPLVDNFQVNGKGQLLVTGFGEFYVEDVKQKSGKIELVGRFVRFVRNAEIDETLEDNGLYGAKLVE